MNYGLKPVSRLTIVFILAVLLSGSVLAYFSISNISNLKELTEKRILEEQRELSARFSAAVTDMLGRVTCSFGNDTGMPGKLKDALLKKTNESGFIIQPFILNNKGQFFYPNFAGIPPGKNEVGFSERFVSFFNDGEKAEFAEVNLREAKENYLLCLSYARGSSDSVRALNALGRITAKMGNYAGAKGYYRLIISDYSSVADANGISYVYYALPQLLKISDPDNSEEILPSIQVCLEKMEAGSVPLNYNTEELLNQVTAWVKENTIHNNEKSDNINNLTRSVKQQVQFVIKYGNELAEQLRKENQNNYQAAGNDFKVINATSENNREFFLIDTNFEDPPGFLIDRGKFLDAVLITDIQTDLEFDYKIVLPGLNNSNSDRRDLVYTSQLTPWFPDQAMEIKLTDENLIKDLIKRRSWIYGFASVLLLVAMCLGVILILRDIARERNLARLRSDFISNVTHELKTPLTSIRMYAESLMMGRVKSDSMQNEYLSVVVNETDRLKRMINNILEFSKMEKGRPEYHFVSSNLSSILKEALQEMNYWLEREQFDVVTELDEKVYAEVDREKMKQAIVNLLSNAIKYSADTKEIAIRLYREPDHVCTEVEDKGTGIPEDKLSRIFEAFYRIEQKEGASGTGLGLTVVKEIVKAHNGTISVTSEIGRGSKFVITLNQQTGKSENNPCN